MNVDNVRDPFDDVVAPIQKAKIDPIMSAYAADDESELPLPMMRKCGRHYEIIDGRHRTLVAIIKRKKKMEVAIKREVKIPKAVTKIAFKKPGKKPVRNIPLTSLDDL